MYLTCKMLHAAECPGLDLSSLFNTITSVFAVDGSLLQITKKCHERLLQVNYHVWLRLPHVYHRPNPVLKGLFPPNFSETRKTERAGPIISPNGLQVSLLKCR